MASETIIIEDSEVNVETNEFGSVFFSPSGLVFDGEGVEEFNEIPAYY